MNRLLLLLCCCFVYQFGYSQIVNAYAKITHINVTTLQVTLVDEAFDSFEDGEQVLIYQVQDSVVNDFSNTVSSGDLFTIGSAGLFELATILSHTEVAGIPTSITLSTPLINPYNSTPNASLQIISFPKLGAPNYSTTGVLTGRPWNGNTGGVVAFQVDQTLQLNHDIQANALGFRGGLRSRNQHGPFDCTTGTVVYTSGSDEYGYKAEGIYKNRNVAVQHGRGKFANAGGGGSHHNGGGAGGGNQTEGGIGGTGYSRTATGCPLANACGGIGGLALNNFIANNRLFLGGGGGGGQQNNSQSSDGGHGGGFIFIKADTLQVANCTANPSITANGQTAISRGNDGMGGGGAGGSILLDIRHYDVPNTCPLNVTANGGAGGSVNSSTHGGGGGGGQGTIRQLNPTSSNIQAIANSGLGGCSNSACTVVAAAGADSATLLQTEWLHFDAAYQATTQAVDLSWSYLLAEDLLYAQLERSQDGIQWTLVQEWGSSAASSTALYYHYQDATLSNDVAYYRVKLVLATGQTTYSAVRAVRLPAILGKGVYLGPNPTTDLITLSSQQAAIEWYHLYNSLGQVVDAQVGGQFNQKGSVLELDLRQLEAGIYILNTSVGKFKLQKL